MRKTKQQDAAIQKPEGADEEDMEWLRKNGVAAAMMGIFCGVYCGVCCSVLQCVAVCCSVMPTKQTWSGCAKMARLLLCGVYVAVSVAVYYSYVLSFIDYCKLLKTLMTRKEYSRVECRCGNVNIPAHVCIR